MYQWRRAELERKAHDRPDKDMGGPGLRGHTFVSGTSCSKVVAAMAPKVNAQLIYLKVEEFCPQYSRPPATPLLI